MRIIAYFLLPLYINAPDRTHRRSQDFLWGCTLFLTKNLTTFCFVIALSYMVIYVIYCHQLPFCLICGGGVHLRKLHTTQYDGLHNTVYCTVFRLGQLAIRQQISLDGLYYKFTGPEPRPAGGASLSRDHLCETVFLLLYGDQRRHCTL